MISRTDRMLFASLLGIFATIASSSLAAAQTQTPHSLGIFQSQSDIGKPLNGGKANYDAETQTFQISGAGKNMWFGQDEFHFVWKKVKGDFIVRTRALFPKEGIDPHRKLGWMIRSSLQTDSPHINAAVHGDGLTSLQFRRTEGGDTEEMKSELTAADVIQLERQGDRYVMSVARFGQPFVESELTGLELGEEVYLGLFVCSHNADVVETAVFENVRFTVPAATDFVPYRDYIGSRLEQLEVATGKRLVVYETSEGIEAPNWTPDGKEWIYNSRGRMFRFPLDEKKPQVLNTDFASKCNNDHLISPDGKSLGISHHAEDAKFNSLIYTLPIEGGVPQQITPTGPSYLHGWSPDGKTLLYTAQRDDDFDIYSMPVEGGPETRLTTSKGLDDGSEYSPDGKFIYFNSARTGTMQLWRMKVDGSRQEQLTDDLYNDWFPHVSPDGKQLVFISFPPDIEADQHPFYQRVYIRTMNIETKAIQVVAYVYGGQGTLNVPSWSPDSRHIAFVSNTASASDSGQ